MRACLVIEVPRIIPAYAGSTHLGASMCTSARDHPRIRGEHAAHGFTSRGRRGSSPHTRGARPIPEHCQMAERIIPAYAGSTGLSGDLAPLVRDHPRIRGEHDVSHTTPSGLDGSSPHTRGARFFGGVLLDATGIIPAYAGSTSPGFMSASCCAGSSPHTRGARPVGGSCAGAGGIIPAYAGSTDRIRAGPVGGPDHPRIRGEHDPCPLALCATVGSSPHTRGARADEPRHRRRKRIIPAYAGSTVCGLSK